MMRNRDLRDPGLPLYASRRCHFMIQGTRMEFSLVDLNEVVETALALLEFRFRNSPVRVRCELAEDLPLVLGDANRLTEVFVNLMNNTLDVMPGGRPADLADKSGRGWQRTVCLD